MYICIIVYVEQLKGGLHFPLDYFIMVVLSLFRTSIAHIYSNGWRILISFIFLYRLYGITLYARVIASMYALSHRGTEAFYYFFLKKRSGLFDGFLQCLKNWKSKFFILRYPSRKGWDNFPESWNFHPHRFKGTHQMIGDAFLIYSHLLAIAYPKGNNLLFVLKREHIWLMLLVYLWRRLMMVFILCFF